METKWTKWYAMTSHVIAYRSLELLFSTHTFHFNCFFDDFNCVFTQIRCLSRVLTIAFLTYQKFKDNLPLNFFCKYFVGILQLLGFKFLKFRIFSPMLFFKYSVWVVLVLFTLILLITFNAYNICNNFMCHFRLSFFFSLSFFEVVSFSFFLFFFNFFS